MPLSAPTGQGREWVSEGPMSSIEDKKVRQRGMGGFTWGIIIKNYFMGFLKNTF